MSELIFNRTHGGTFAKRCKHFAGVNFTDPEKRCDAGCLMADVIKPVEYSYRYGSEGSGATVYRSSHSMPCFRDGDPLGVCRCEKQAFPTAEEVEADRKETEELFGRSMKARIAIIKATEGKRGVSGDIPCPVCNTGRLNYSVASCNGHIHAACTTEDCVRWME